MSQIKDRQELIQQISAGRDFKFLFFWGHKKPPDGSVNHSCLSQWYEAGFEQDGNYYPTAEHYMMAAKARLFGDVAIEQKIMQCDHPNEAKKLGRLVSGFNTEQWNQSRFDIVVAANIAKFAQNPPLKHYLLDTGSRVLVEASPRDRIWGIGMGKNNPDAGIPKNWRGLNLLGFALMVVRAQLSTVPESEQET